MWWILILILFFFWGSFVTFKFFQYHPEFVRIFKPYFSFFGYYIGFLFIFLLASFLIGYKIQKIFKPPFNFLERIIFSIAIGLGVFIYLGILMATFRLLYSWVFWVVFVSIFLLCIKEIKELFFYRDLKKIEDTVANQKNKKADIFAIFFLGILLLILFISVFTPRIGWDDAVYHFQLPKLYIENGGFYFISRNVYSNMPLNIQMLYMLALLVSDYVLAKLIHFTFLCLLLLAIYSFCKRFFSKRCAILSVLIFLINPIVLDVIYLTYVDIPLAFYVFCAIYNFILLKNLNCQRLFYMCSLFCGISAGIKYHGFFIIPIIGIGILIEAFYRRDKVGQRHIIKLILKRFFILLSFIFLLFSPWLIKNIIFTGNPFYPFFYGLFGGVEWSKELTVKCKEFFLSHGMGRSFLDYILLPYRMVVMGSTSYYKFAGILHPLYLIFLPLLFSLKKKDIFYYLLGYSFLWFLCWAFTSQQLRFFIPALVTLSIIIGYSIDNFSSLFKREIIYNILLTFVLSIAMFCSFSTVQNLIRWNIPYLLGKESPEAYLARTHPPYLMYLYINENLPFDSKLLFIYENRGFFCDRKFLMDSVFEASWIMELARKKKVEGFKEYLIKEGITHILINRLNQRIFCKDQIGMLIVEKFLKKYCQKICFKNYLELYKIKLYE